MRQASGELSFPAAAKRARTVVGVSSLEKKLVAMLGKLAVVTVLCVCGLTPADAAPRPSQQHQMREATTEAVIVCAGPDDPDPEECTFTAPADGSYSFVWAEQPTEGFDLIKLGLEPVDAIYIGPRFGTYFTDCCEGEACEFEDLNLVRFSGGACAEAPSAPIPGDPPPPPPPDNPSCEPEPGLPVLQCCALEPVGACQRACCCDSGDADFVEAYCRGVPGNSTRSITSTIASAPTAAATTTAAGNYTGLVVRAELRAGQSLLLITSDGGLMSRRGDTKSSDGNATAGDASEPSFIAVPTEPSANAVRATQDMAIVCADPEGPGNPTECQFTAPATGRYSFVWAAAASFDVVKLGAEPIPFGFIGDRFGVYFTGCCGLSLEDPCLWEDSNPIRFANTCPPGSPTDAVPGDPPPPPPPDNPSCEPEPGLPVLQCCALEPVGACQRACCCDSGDADFVEAYCRGVPGNSTRSIASVRAALPDQSHLAATGRRQAYGGLVMGLELEAGFTVTLLTQSGGLM